MHSALIRSRRGYPAVHLAAQQADQRSVRHGPLVLVPEPRKSHAPTIDRDRTVSRRSEPSSRATLIGEQPNPWDLLQPQDVTSRHRGWESSACYPRSTFYPLSDGPSMRNRRITMPLFPTCSACLPPSQAPFCHYTLRTVTNRPEGTFGSLRYAFGGDHPSQTARQAVSSNFRVSGQTAEGPYFNSGSTRTGVRASKPPAYPTHPMPGRSTKLQ